MNVERHWNVKLQNGKKKLARERIFFVLWRRMKDLFVPYVNRRKLKANLFKLKGDSGGGLIGQFEDASFGGGKRWFLLGIVSFGIPCDDAHLGYMEPGAQASLI